MHEFSLHLACTDSSLSRLDWVAHTFSFGEAEANKSQPGLHNDTFCCGVGEKIPVFLESWSGLFGSMADASE